MCGRECISLSPPNFPEFTFAHRKTLYFRKKWEIRVFRKKNQYTLEEHAAAIPFDLS